ncbi:hypothetical protein SERLA73DRAFT_37319, partial [Serpula lacrymans var. lacrymans S7.3]
PVRQRKGKKIQELVTIGQQLEEDQKTKVCTLIEKYADVFALLLAEVQPVASYVHKLNLPPDISGPMRLRQKTLMEPQKEWLYAMLDDMVEAGIIRTMSANKVKWVS